MEKEYGIVEYEAQGEHKKRFVAGIRCIYDPKNEKNEVFECSVQADKKQHIEIKGALWPDIYASKYSAKPGTIFMDVTGEGSTIYFLPSKFDKKFEKSPKIPTVTLSNLKHMFAVIGGDLS